MNLSKGVICAADRHQEWLLPWWWERYREDHDYPVLFVDYGLSHEMAAWCRQRGATLVLHPYPVATKSEIDPVLVQQWENEYGPQLWISRHAWFQKPHALLQSPFRRSVWIDLDCEILQPIHELFEIPLGPSELTLSREPPWVGWDRSQAKVAFNSGVVAYAPTSPIISKWAAASLTQSHLYLGDDFLLSEILFDTQAPLVELPDHYNWRLSQGFNPNAAIIHWAGSWGKEFIAKFGGLKPLLLP